MTLEVTRKDAPKTRVIHALAFGLPAALGAWLFSRGDAAGVGFGLALALVAAFLARINLRFPDRVGFEDGRLVLRRMWTRSVVRHEAARLLDLRVRPVEVAPSKLRPASAQLIFESGHAFIAADFFPEATPILEALIDARIYPITLGPAVLVNWHRYVEDRRLGVSATYGLASGAIVSLYVYEGGGGQSREAHLAQCMDEVRQMSAQQGTRVEAERRATIGDYDGAVFELASPRGHLASHLYLGGREGAWRKLRATAIAGADADELERVIPEMIAAFPS